MSNLSVQVETSFTNLEPLREEWNDFIIEIGSDLYMSFDYCRLWWEVLGLKRKLRIFLIREEGRLVGVLPMLIDRIQLGPAWLRVARALGSDLVREMFIPAVHPSKAEEVYGEVLSHLFEQDRCDALVWGCYSKLNDTSDALRKAAAARADRVKLLRDRTMEFPHGNFFLPPTFEEYLNSLGSSHRYNYRRYSRRIRNRMDVEITMIRNPELAIGEFPKFRELYDQLHLSKERPGHFLGDPLREKFWLKLCEDLGARDEVRLLRISGDDRVLAYDYSFKFGKAYFGKYRARVFGAEWNNLGVGSVALVELIRAAIEEGMNRLESGAGHFEYKMEYGATETPIGSMLFVANRPSVRRRFRFFEKMVKLLDLLYLRIWFFKLRPRLPIPPKTRWKLWYRTRL